MKCLVVADHVVVTLQKLRRNGWKRILETKRYFLFSLSSLLSPSMAF